MGQERLGPSHFFIPLVLGPPNSLVWSVPSLRYTRGLGWHMHYGAEVTESSTNKQHHLPGHIHTLRGSERGHPCARREVIHALQGRPSTRSRKVIHTLQGRRSTRCSTRSKGGDPRDPREVIHALRGRSPQAPRELITALKEGRSPRASGEIIHALQGRPST